MNFHSHTEIRRRILRGQLRGDRVHRDLGLAFAHTRSQARYHSTLMRSTIMDEASVAIRSDRGQKQIVVPIAPTVEIEVRRKNANDRPARAVEIDRAITAHGCEARSWMKLPSPYVPIAGRNRSLFP